MYIGLKNIRNLFSNYRTKLIFSDSMHCLTGWRLPENDDDGFFPHTLYVFNSNKTELPDDLTDGHILYIVPASSDLDEIAAKISAYNRPFTELDSDLLLILKKYVYEHLKNDVFVRTNRGFFNPAEGVYRNRRKNLH